MAKSSANSSATELSISNSDKSNVRSREQKRFDMLTKRIKDLEIKLEKDQKKLDVTLQEYTSKVFPLNKKIIEKKSEFVFKLDEKANKFKLLSKKQREKISDVILSELNDIFEQQDPTNAQEELYNKWSDTTFKEEVEEQETFEREMFEESIKHSFDGKIDMSDFENTPEGHARIRERIEALKEEKTKEYNTHQSSKKPTKKELLQQQAEALKLKGIRSIYISLVKVLHPDSEQDEVLKIKKNELMKKVTVAYDNKDIATLLRLEAEWVSQTTDRLSSLSDNTLKLYNETLYDRVQELEYEKFMLYKNPAYQKIVPFIHLSAKRISSEIDAVVTNNQLAIVELDESMELIYDSQSKSEFIEFVSDYIEFTLGDDDDFDEDFFNIFFK